MPENYKGSLRDTRKIGAMVIKKRRAQGREQLQVALVTVLL
jgi:hypothetical protein